MGSLKHKLDVARIRESWNKLPVSILLGVLSVALIGGYGHWYGDAKGYGVFYCSAWDENTYALDYMAGSVPVNRLIGWSIFRVVEVILGGGMKALLALDIIAPVLSFLAAVFLARTIWGRGSKWCVPTALVFLVAPPVFCFGYNLTFWTSDYNVLHWGRTLEEWAKAWIPWTHTMTYNPIFRTPEPQLSVIFSFAFLALFIHWFLGDICSIKTRIGAFALGVGFLTVYVFCTAPVLVFVCLCIFLAICFRVPVRRLLTGSLFVFGFLAASIAHSLLSTGAKEDSLVFSSHMPVLTPLVLFSLIGFSLALFLPGRAGKEVRVKVLVMSAFLVPVALQNQQIITGKMILPGKWETFGGPLFFFLGLCLSIARGGVGKVFLKRLSCAGSAALVGLLAVFVLGLTQYRTMELFEPANRTASSVAEALESVIDLEAASKSVRVVLSGPHLETPVKLRMSKDIELVYGYLTTNRQDPIARLDDVSAYRESARNAFSHVFEHLSRMGWRASDLENELKSIVAGTGSSLALALFNPMDVWAPFSEGRALNLNLVSTQIDWIVSSYSDYLSRGAPEWSTEALVVLVGDEEVPDWNSSWDTSLFYEEVIREERVRIFRQTFLGKSR